MERMHLRKSADFLQKSAVLMKSWRNQRDRNWSMHLTLWRLPLEPVRK